MGRFEERKNNWDWKGKGKKKKTKKKKEWNVERALYGRPHRPTITINYLHLSLFLSLLLLPKINLFSQISQPSGRIPLKFILTNRKELQILWIVSSINCILQISPSINQLKLIMSCSSSSGSEEEDEDLDCYRKGGYHAVRVGDTFSGGRYVAQRKLGWGQFSTVWLAYDTQTSVSFSIFCSITYKFLLRNLWSMRFLFFFNLMIIRYCKWVYNFL